MIEIGINPNTKIPSVAIRMIAYFGLNEDGIKLVDSDKVFKAEDVEKSISIPTEAFDNLIASKQENNNKTVDNGKEESYRDEKGRFKSGNTFSVGNGRPSISTTPITDRLRVLLENKHYEIKGGGTKRAIDLLTEVLLDKAIAQRDLKALNEILDRIDGKVTQGIKVSGALAHGEVSEEDIKKYSALFPDAKNKE